MKQFFATFRAQNIYSKCGSNPQQQFVYVLSDKTGDCKPAPHYLDCTKVLCVSVSMNYAMANKPTPAAGDAAFADAKAQVPCLSMFMQQRWICV